MGNSWGMAWGTDCCTGSSWWTGSVLYPFAAITFLILLISSHALDSRIFSGLLLLGPPTSALVSWGILG